MRLADIHLDEVRGTVDNARPGRSYWVHVFGDPKSLEAFRMSGGQS